MSNLLSDHEVHKVVCEKECQQWKVRFQEAVGEWVKQISKIMADKETRSIFAKLEAKFHVSQWKTLWEKERSRGQCEQLENVNHELQRINKKKDVMGILKQSVIKKIKMLFLVVSDVFLTHGFGSLGNRFWAS